MRRIGLCLLIGFLFSSFLYGVAFSQGKSAAHNNAPGLFLPTPDQDTPVSVPVVKAGREASSPQPVESNKEIRKTGKEVEGAQLVLSPLFWMFSS